ncbi:hypothetical protein CR513_02495, partial [Mucuna pruriens]
MAIPKGTTRGLASFVVIIALIVSKTAAQVVSPNGSLANNVSKPIKQDKTIRVDPLDNFKKYRGGFDITNKHYWASVIFTGVCGYAIGVLWLLCGMVCGFFWLTNFCCQSDGGRRTKNILPYDFSPIPMAIAFLILTLVASVLVYVGSAKFYYEARTSVNIIIKIADDASEIIHNATRALEDIQEDLVESNISAEVSGKLDSTARNLDNAVDNIVNKTRKNKRTINRTLKLVYNNHCDHKLEFSCGTNFVSFWSTDVMEGILHVCCTVLVDDDDMLANLWIYNQFLSNLLIILFILSKYKLFLLKCFVRVIFSNDTCTVLYNFEENPYNNSLTSILPCDELRSAKLILLKVGEGISHLVNEVNSNMGSLFPDHVSLCNPFSAPPQYLYQPESCPPNSIQIEDIPKVLKPFTCSDHSGEKCSSGDFMDDGEYEIVVSYTSSIQDLLNMYPGMEELIGCQLVKDAFSQILLKHCNPLKEFARMTWIGMVFLAVVMVLFLVLWTIKACQDHIYHPTDGSV